VVDKAGRADPVEVIAMILDAGADVNAVNEQQTTAVHLAASRGNDKVVQYLASRGARLDIKNRQGKTPAEIAPKRTADLIAKLTNGAPASDKAPVAAAAAVAPPPVASAASGFPEAPARYILEGNCTTCHTLDRVKAKHFDKESWTGLIDSMRGKRGGPKDLTDDQIQELADYLSKNFGPAAK